MGLKLLYNFLYIFNIDFFNSLKLKQIKIYVIKSQLIEWGVDKMYLDNTDLMLTSCKMYTP